MHARSRVRRPRVLGSPRSKSSAKAHASKAEKHAATALASETPVTNRKPRQRPKWNSTIHDLSVYKLSKDEQVAKSVSLISHNNILAFKELERKLGGDFGRAAEMAPMVAHSGSAVVQAVHRARTHSTPSRVRSAQTARTPQAPSSVVSPAAKLTGSDNTVQAAARSNLTSPPLRSIVSPLPPSAGARRDIAAALTPMTERADDFMKGVDDAVRLYRLRRAGHMRILNFADPLHTTHIPDDPFRSLSPIATRRSTEAKSVETQHSTAKTARPIFPDQRDGEPSDGCSVAGSQGDACDNDRHDDGEDDGLAPLLDTSKMEERVCEFEARLRSLGPDPVMQAFREFGVDISDALLTGKLGPSAPVEPLADAADVAEQLAFELDLERSAAGNNSTNSDDEEAAELPTQISHESFSVEEEVKAPLAPPPLPMSSKASPWVPESAAGNVDDSDSDSEPQPRPQPAAVAAAPLVEKPPARPNRLVSAAPNLRATSALKPAALPSHAVPDAVPRVPPVAPPVAGGAARVMVGSPAGRVVLRQPRISSGNTSTDSADSMSPMRPRMLWSRFETSPK